MPVDDADLVEQRNDPAGRAEIAAQYDSLAARLARRFAGRGEPIDDLMQVARLGLVGAMDRYEPGHGATFATFATRTIVGELKRYLRDKAWAIRVPRSVQERVLEVNESVQHLSQRLGRSPSLREIAADIDSDVEKVIEALDAGRAFTATSVDTTAVGDDRRPIIDTLGRVDGDLHRAADRVTLAEFIADLDDRERTILHQRFYEGKSQSEIAETLGISQMHVSRLLRSTLATLREQVTGV